MKDRFLRQEVTFNSANGEKVRSLPEIRLYLISKTDCYAPKAATHICEHGNYYKRGVHGKWFVWRDDEWLSVRAEVRAINRIVSSPLVEPLHSEQRSGIVKNLRDSNARLSKVRVTHNGETLKQMRMKAGLSRHDVAKVLNVSVTTVGRLEAVSGAYTMRYCYTQYRDFLLSHL